MDFETQLFVCKCSNSKRKEKGNHKKKQRGSKIKAIAKIMKGI